MSPSGPTNSLLRRYYAVVPPTDCNRLGRRAERVPSLVLAFSVGRAWCGASRRAPGKRVAPDVREGPNAKLAGRHRTDEPAEHLDIDVNDGHREVCALNARSATLDLLFPQESPAAVFTCEHSAGLWSKWLGPLTGELTQVDAPPGKETL